jgi:hypothetical protein
MVYKYYKESIEYFYLGHGVYVNYMLWEYLRMIQTKRFKFGSIINLKFENVVQEEFIRS